MVKQPKANKNTTARLADAIGHLGLPNAIIKKEKKKYLRSYHERSSLRGTHRIYGVAVTTVLRWLKKKQRA